MTTHRICSVVASLVLAAVTAPWTAQAAPTVVPTGMLELDHRTVLGDGPPVSSVTAESGSGSGAQAAFALSRFRAGLKVVEGPWRAQLTVEASNDFMRVLDAYADYKVNAAMVLQVGQARGPIGGLFHRESITGQAFSERAAIELAFRQRRDLGVGFDWQPANLPLAVNARVGNGSGPEGWQPALYLALEGRFGRAHRTAGPQWFGLWVGLSGLMESVEDRRSVGFSSPFGSALVRGLPVHGDRLVTDAFVVAYLGQVRLRVEGAFAQEAAARTAALGSGLPERRADYRSLGTAFEVNWLLRGTPRRVGKAPKAPAEGPAVEISARADLMIAPLDEGIGEPQVVLGALAAKAWMNDWWALALVGFYGSGRAYRIGAEGPLAILDVDEGGVFLRNTFYFTGK